MVVVMVNKSKIANQPLFSSLSLFCLLLCLCCLQTCAIKILCQSTDPVSKGGSLDSRLWTWVC